MAMASWPFGTGASASSSHDKQPVATADCPQGCSYTYGPFNAIDRNSTTFWNDDTEGTFPDSFFLSFPSSAPVNLTGLSIQSNLDGYITAYDIYLTVSSSMTPFLAASASGVAAVFSTVNSWNVPNSHINGKGEILGITGLEIRVNSAQNTLPNNWYSRINEVYPIYAAAAVSSSSTASTSATQSTTTVTATAGASHSSSGSSSHTGAIAGGVVGGVVLIAALIVLGMLLARRRRKRNIEAAPVMSHYGTYSGATNAPVSEIPAAPAYTDAKVAPQVSELSDHRTNKSRMSAPGNLTELPANRY